MQPHLLPFIQLTPRSDKPRQRGLTIVKDPGYPTDWLRGMLEMYADFVDQAKFPMAFTPFPAKSIEERIRCYRDFQIDVAVDDPMFQLAYLQGQEETFFRTLRDMGVTNVQVDIPATPSRSLAERREEEARCLQLALSLGLQVDGEVGQKYPEGDLTRADDGLLNVEATIEEAQRQISLGCRRVYLENAVIQAVIGDKARRAAGTAQICRVAETIGPDRFIVEINGCIMPFERAQYARFWAVKNFGPDVNMGGGERLEDILYIESMRLGISFVPGEAKNPRLWVNSLRRHGGQAAAEWWREED